MPHIVPKPEETTRPTSLSVPIHPRPAQQNISQARTSPTLILDLPRHFLDKDLTKSYLMNKLWALERFQIPI